MKSNILYIVCLLVGLSSCTKIPQEKGFLSPDIYLKGADTLLLPLGTKGSTDVAWLDGTSMPVQFSIENVRDKNGQRSEQFFEKYLYRTWAQPYNNKTDTTLELINAKLREVELPAFTINPVNGQIQYLETTRNFLNPGDVFNVDVRAKNSKGERVYEDYVTLKLSPKDRPFQLFNATVAILLLNDAGESKFTLYDNIVDEDAVRRQNIYDRNGKELVDIYKLEDIPTVGIKVLIQYKDAEGQIFDSKEYQTYSTTTESYFDYAVNRENTSEGAMIEFPVTPWPTRNDLLSYLRGGTMDYSVLDTATLRRELYTDNKYAFLDQWPEPEWNPTKWYIRLRSKVLFKESGTYVISCTFPYTHLDKTF
jgi:hypothetical protein